MPKVPETLHSRPPLEQTHRIVHLLKNDAIPNCVEIAAEFDVFNTTIERDVDFMKVRYPLPFESTGQNYGYFFSGPVENFPTMPRTDPEKFSLFIAQRAMNQYRGTSFGDPIETAFCKLISNRRSPGSAGEALRV